MIPPAYHRSLLTPQEQAVYREVVLALRDHKTAVHLALGLAPQSGIRKAVRAVHLDHPELFYVDFWHYQLQSAPSGTGFLLRFPMLLDPFPAEAIANSLSQKVSELRNRMTECTTASQAYILLIREISTQTRYQNTESAFWDHTVAGPLLNHSAVCEGISKYFLFLCQRLNLPCAVVVGTLNGGSHAWNMVEIDGVRKYVDITALLSSTFPVTKEVFKSEEQLLQRGYVII